MASGKAAVGANVRVDECEGGGESGCYGRVCIEGSGVSVAARRR